MKKTFLVFTCSLALIACKESKKTVATPEKPVYIDVTSLEGDGDKVLPKYMKSITEDELKEMLYFYASDEMEGRNTGDPGQKKAVEYLRNYYSIPF